MKIYGRLFTIYDKLSGKVFIGRTCTSIAKCWERYVTNATQAVAPFSAINQAIREHDAENFTLSELSTAYSQEELDAKERAAIAEFQADKKHSGLNVTLYRPTSKKGRRMATPTPFLEGWGQSYPPPMFPPNVPTMFPPNPNPMREMRGGNHRSPQLPKTCPNCGGSTNLAVADIQAAIEAVAAKLAASKPGESEVNEMIEQIRIQQYVVATAAHLHQAGFCLKKRQVITIVRSAAAMNGEHFRRLSGIDL